MEVIANHVVAFLGSLAVLVSHSVITQLTGQNQIKVFTVFFSRTLLLGIFWISNPSRLILNRFDSSTEEQIIETNDVINIATKNLKFHVSTLDRASRGW